MSNSSAALSALAEVMPSYKLLLNAPLVSGRLLVAHAAAASNRSLLQALFSSPISQPVPSTVLRHDLTGRNALDYALKNHDGVLAERMAYQAGACAGRLASQLLFAVGHAVLGCWLRSWRRF